MSNQIEQIRAEIERRKKVNLEEGETGWTCVDEDDEILHFIDHLPAEEVSADIEKEIEERANEVGCCDFCHASEIQERYEWCKEQFRHFYALGAKSQPAPADIQEVEIRKISISPSEVRYVIDAIPSYAGIFRSEDDAKKGLAIFKAGIDYERERLMKEAPVAEVREVSGGADAPFYLGLTFREIPRFEFSGKPVRVIIEEIKEVGK